MPLSNDIIQSLWIGSELSIMELLTIKSFLANGHTFHLYTYNQVANVPQGTVVKDANEILPASKIFTCMNDEWGRGSYAPFSDYFRYILLYKKGGWWVDMDVICLKYFDFKEEEIVSSLFSGKVGMHPFNNVIKAPKSSRLMAFLCSYIEENIDFKSVKYVEMGSDLISTAIKKLSLEHVVVPYDYFNPYTYTDVDRLAFKYDNPLRYVVEWAKDKIRPSLKPQASKRMTTKNSYAVHLFNDVWRRNSIDKNASYSLFSPYEQLKRRYL